MLRKGEGVNEPQQAVGGKKVQQTADVPDVGSPNNMLVNELGGSTQPIIPVEPICNQSSSKDTRMSTDIIQYF